MRSGRKVYALAVLWEKRLGYRRWWIFRIFIPHSIITSISMRLGFPHDAKGELTRQAAPIL